MFLWYNCSIASFNDPSRVPKAPFEVKKDIFAGFDTLSADAEAAMARVDAIHADMIRGVRDDFLNADAIIDDSDFDDGHNLPGHDALHSAL